MTRVAVALATAGGAGYVPVAPGTVGSAVGVVIYLATRHWLPAWQIILVVAISLVGTWAAHVTARHLATDDPGPVVIDEVAGQLVTLLFLGGSWGYILLGFLFFRAFDIIKPWPASRFEALPGGLGIMADDLMAGVYAHLLLRLIVLVVYGISF